MLINGNDMIPHEILREYIMNGVRFQYESYDHKKAMEELMQTNNTNLSSLNIKMCHPSWHVPVEIRKKHTIWRTGKLWELHFNKNGEMVVFKIGRCRPYIKIFYFVDFGVIVKPMIFKSDDKYNLIGQGLAVEETL
jgi:hypothetical protein